MTATVHSVFVQLEAPRGNSPGKVVEGCYTIENGAVVLTNRHGDSVRDDGGNKYAQKLAEGDNPKQIAARLTKELRKALRGNNGPPRGFRGPIEYPKVKCV